MERTGAKAERTYQSGKTQRRNANKKKCLLRRRMLAQSAMASPAQNPPIQVVDVDVPNALSNISMPIGSTTKARFGDTLIAEFKETEKAHCSDHTVVLMKKTAEVSDTQETALSVIEPLKLSQCQAMSYKMLSLLKMMKRTLKKTNPIKWILTTLLFVCESKTILLLMLVKRNGEIQIDIVSFCYMQKTRDILIVLAKSFRFR